MGSSFAEPRRGRTVDQIGAADRAEADAADKTRPIGTRLLDGQGSVPRNRGGCGVVVEPRLRLNNTWKVVLPTVEPGSPLSTEVGNGYGQEPGPS